MYSLLYSIRLVAREVMNVTGNERRIKLETIGDLMRQYQRLIEQRMRLKAAFDSVTSFDFSQTVRCGHCGRLECSH